MLFKYLLNDSIYISSSAETPPTKKKLKEEDDIRNDYNIWKTPGDDTEFVLQCLRYEISDSSQIYMEFGDY